VHLPGAIQPNPLEEVYRDNTINLHWGTGGNELLTITVGHNNHIVCVASASSLHRHQAGFVVSIQAQLLTSNVIASSTISRIFLVVGMIFELLGVMLVIYFTRFPANHSRKSWRAIFRVASEIPTLLIIIGIIFLAAALVVDLFDISVGTGVAISGVLIIGVLSCLLAWCFGMEGRIVNQDQT
jgi:hypothetical protein